jgi:hypothetical protein
MTFQTNSNFNKTLVEPNSQTTFYSSAAFKKIKEEHGTFKSIGQTGNLSLHSEFRNT